MTIEDQKQQAGAWFRELRDRICAEFEAIEHSTGQGSGPARSADYDKPSCFTRNNWERDGGGGGEMSVMKGRVFEKVGVNISTVHGEFSETMRKEMPGAADKPYFWASGISIVAHMCSPLVPAVHMNTRMLVISKDSVSGVRDSGKKDFLSPESRTPDTESCKSWFGGGADLTPIFPNDDDTQDFHTALKQACDRTDHSYYPQFKQRCDEYFHLKHRDEPRGIGGIFYDYMNSGDWDKDFRFTRDVGEAFLHIYPQLVRRHMHEAWTPEQREAQLYKRGRYVEFNLLYDRGTRFGLLTNGNVDAILMSLPPEVKWK